MVRVVPARLPAKVIVAPNSPSARAQHRTAPAATDGPTIGSVTRRKAVHRLAPSVAAASSYRRSVERSAPSTATTRNGIATNVSATTTPAVLNGSVNHRSRGPPPAEEERLCDDPPPAHAAGGADGRRNPLPRGPPDDAGAANRQQQRAPADARREPQGQRDERAQQRPPREAHPGQQPAQRYTE